MANWIIYGSDNVAKATVKELELHDEWMAECFLTVSVKSAEPIDFAVGDYIDYRGERYTIQYDPNVLKKAEYGSYGEGFTYDNIKFVGLQDEVVRCDFNDIVLNDNNVHYTALPTFPFYCETVDDLLDRIQANLEELYPGQWIVIGLNTVRNSQRGTAVGRAQAFVNAYKQYIDPTGAANTEPYGKQGVAETVDNITCWDAMKKVHDDFELNFIVRGRVIIVGTAGVFTANTFRYGKGNGLYEIERIGDSDQQIVTRLRAYGSEQNLPQHYYATQNKDVYATITNLKNKFGTQGAEFILDLDFDKKYFTYQSVSYPTTGSYPNYIVTIKANDISVRAYVTKDSTSSKCYVYCEYTGGMDDRDEPDASAMASFVTALANGDKVYFEDYVKKETFGEGHYEFVSENLPDNMSVSRLMMPGFPNQSLNDWVEAHKNLNGYEWLAKAVEEGFTFSTDKYRPYIDSPNIDEYGVRPGSVMFDGSNETEDIHPTIEGMMYGNAPVDEIYAADQVEDNGVYPAGEEVKNINVILPTLGFDLDKVFEDGATIDMKNGMCGARSFKIANTPTKDSNNHWICNIERVHDDSLDLWFPYEDFQIHGSSEVGRDHGDKYVLTGITMPDEYIAFAAEKLLQAAIDALKKNHAPRYTYQPRIDELWMQRQHDSSLNDSDVVSLHDTLKAGDVFAFADDDLNIDANIIIDILTIRENGNYGVPTYEITLRDEKEVGTIQKIANKIDSAFSSAMNGAGGGCGLTPQQIQSLVRQEGNDRYLSKVDDDTAKGNISFEKNINVGGRETVNELQSTEYTGDGLLDTGYRLWYEEGRAKLVIDDLVARGKFTANELETRIWTYAGGNMVFSGAGSTLFFVEYLDGNENPLGYTYINQPWLLRGRALLAGGLAWSKRKAIQRELTEAEKAQVVKFRCYEYSDDGTMQTRNWWKPNDIAMCETLNKVREKAASDGSYSGSASNTVYKRRIAGIGSKEIPMLNDGRVYDYVDLWNIYDLAGNNCKYKDLNGDEVEITDNVKGYDSTYHDWPAAGDVIVQMGNPLDADRQSAVTIEVQGNVHGFKVYDTISDYSMANKLWVEIGYDQTTGKAKANVYGDFRFGCRENEEANGGSYIKYNRTTKQLDIKANVRFMSPTSPQQETTLDSFASAVVGDLSNLQSQIDGQIESWFYNYSPVHVDSEGVPDSNVPLNVAPYSDWNTDALKIAHLGDTFTNNETGYCWRFSRNATTNAFEWVIIEDSAVIKALQDAARAQDTADHKRRTFVLPVTIGGVTYNYPYPPYDVGDLWVNAIYPSNYTGETDESQHKYKNEILKCITSKPLDTDTFSINDWSLSNGYTSKLNNFVTNTYSPFVTQITEQVDKKAETWRQATDPSIPWYDDTQTPVVDVRIHHVGDLWYNTGNNNNFKYQGTYIYENTGTDANPIYGWVEEAIPDEVFDAIDGKAAIYAGWEDWIVGGVSQLNDKDLYIPNTDYPANNPTYKANKVYRWNASNSTWNEVAYTDDTYAHGFDYLKAAMKGDTQIQGGLLLSNTIVLRNLDFSTTPATPTDIMAGMNGVLNSDLTDPKKSIAAWYGGDMIDYESLTDAQKAAGWGTGTGQQRYAKTLFRMDGTGYMAGGKISWDGNGDGFVAGGNVSWQTNQQTGVTTVNINGSVINAATKIDTPAIFLNGTDITSTLNAILSMFTLEGEGTQLSPYVIKANYSLYSEGDISALGNSTSGGGGGGASVLYELNDVTPNAAGNEVMGIVITDGQTTAGDGYVLTFDGSTKKWKAAPTTETYVLPQATSGALGGIKIGFTEANKNYAVQLDNAGKAYVNVPWTDNDHYDWSDITNKPSSFTPSAHTHDYIVPKSAITYGANYLQYDDVYATEASNPADAIGNPTADWYHHIVMNHANSGGWFVDMALSFNSNAFYYRRIANGVASDWVRVLDSSGGTLTGALTINPSNTSSFQDGIILNDNGGGASEALTIKWTSASYTTGVKLSANLASNYLIFHDGKAWQTIYHSGNNPFVIRGELADAYINGTTYSTLDNGTYLHAYSGASEAIIHFQRSNCSASGLDIRFKYPQDASNPLQYRKCIDSNRFASTSWVTIIDSLNIGSQSVNYATSAGDADTVDGLHVASGRADSANVIVRTDSSGYLNCGWINTTSGGFYTDESISRVYCSNDGYLRYLSPSDFISKMSILPLSGGTMTGYLALVASKYDGYKKGDARTYGMNANNSDIVGVNSIIMSDKSDSWAESIGFPRDGNDAGHYDTFRAANGTFYFGFNGYFDNSNVEHAAAELVTITGSAIQLARTDANNAELRVKNSGRDLSLFAGATNIGLYYNTGSKWILGTNGTDTWLNTGKVGIGTTSPSYKLHVSGDIYATGGVTCASDIRLKDVLSYQLPLTVEQVAQAPTIKFLWKNKREEGEQVGSVAQYWQKVLPQSVSDKSDELGLSYGVAALISAITTARKVVDHEQRITELEKECERLRTENEQLKLRIA